VKNLHSTIGDRVLERWGGGEGGGMKPPTEGVVRGSCNEGREEDESTQGVKEEGENGNSFQNH